MIYIRQDSLSSSYLQTWALALLRCGCCAVVVVVAVLLIPWGCVEERSAKVKKKNRNYKAVANILRIKSPSYCDGCSCLLVCCR
jgi:hypothetical protein